MKSSSDKVLPSNFLIADFMGHDRCKCCDFGWDGISRSIHHECCECKKHHMEGKFPYKRELDSLLEVTDKLVARGIKTSLTNESTMWKAIVGDNDVGYSENVAEDLNEALYKSVVQTLVKMKGSYV